MLLRRGYLPNLQPCEPVEFSRNGKHIDLRFNRDAELPAECTRRLESINVIGLFREFVSYYAKEFKFEFQCVTLRSSEVIGAITIPKSSWPYPKRWRLCIEDPFEHVDSFNPRDLGCTISTRFGQSRIMSALTNAMTILESAGSSVDGSLDSVENILRLFF